MDRSGVCIGFSPQSCRESAGYYSLWVQFSSATGCKPGQPMDSDLVVCAALAAPLTSVSSLLCLHRAGRSAGLPCMQGSAHSHHPPAITGQCSCVAALQYGAKCPKSHLLLICHLRTACCPCQGHLDLSSYPRHGQQWLCCTW